MSKKTLMPQRMKRMRKVPSMLDPNLKRRKMRWMQRMMTTRTCPRNSE